MASAASQSSVAEQIRQLNDARKHVLLEVNVYPSIVQGILPIIGPASVPELRRWGADFLAEAFATPALPSREKETLSLLVLETIKGMLENPKEDVYVLRSAIQTAASIYPLAMRWIINNSYDTQTWERMTAVKSRILHLWNSEATGVKICCIKFAQRVVLAQSISINPESKRDLDISLAMVPPGHPLLDPHNLEAEATGLLDRMLGILQDNSSDAVIVDATLNCLAILIRTRPGTSNRILNAILNFNPLKLANSPMTPKSRVLVKSMEKTTRMLLAHVIKRDVQNPFAPRIHQYIERLMRSRSEIFDEASRKRALADQHAAALGDAKRQRLAAGSVAVPQLPSIPPLPPGPTSLAAIFTLTNNTGLAAFDVSTVPAGLAARISVSTLARTDLQVLNHVIDGVRGRLTALEAASAQSSPLNPETAPLGVDEDDDDYEPDYYAAEDTEQILNKLDGPSRRDEPPKAGDAAATTVAPAAYRPPSPPPLTPEHAAIAGHGVIANVFNMTKRLEDPGVKKTKAGVNRLAASASDREAWMTVIMRLATRAPASLGDISVKTEGGASQAAHAQTSIGDKLRETLYTYIIEDFRKRIDVAISWLSEEWYNDQLQKKASGITAPLHYDRVAIRLVEGFTPYLHAQDRVLTRFLGEIPEVTVAILDRVKSICRDPSLASLALTSLVYLVMMRPPSKERALDAIQGIWTEYEEARPMAAKFLGRWRKHVLENNGSAAGRSETEATPAVVAA